MIKYRVKLESAFAGASTNYEFDKKEMIMTDEELTQALKNNDTYYIGEELYCVIEFESIN